MPPCRRPTASPEEASRLEALLEAKLEELFGTPSRRAVRALDLGCGDGYATRVVRRCLARVHPRGTLVALDRELTALAVARREAAAGTTAPRWLAADLYALPLPPACVDFALAFNVFHGVDRGAFAEQVLGILRPGGRLLVYDRAPHLRGGAARFAAIFDAPEVAALSRLPRRR